MSHKDKHHPSKKQQIMARNKQRQLINEQVEFHKQSQRSQDEFNEGVLQSLVASAPTTSDGDVVWSAKLQEVRNRVNGKRRMAADRWNRFAGTEGGGGRGR